MAISDLTTLGAAKEWLGVTGTGDDALLTRLVSAVSSYIKQWLNRDLTSKDYTDTRNGTGSARMVMAQAPVTAVASVTIDGRAVPPQAVWGQPGFVFDYRGITLTGYTFTQGRGNVVVSYTAGYAVIPLELEQACLELLALRYRNRDRVGHVSKSVNGETVSFFMGDFPASVKTILKNYAKVIPE